jgi:phosphotransacetylase
VAHPCDASSLAAAVDAAAKRLINPILVGPLSKIREIAGKAQIDLGTIEIVDARHSHAAAAAAVQLVREGKAELLMKGSLHTDELLGASGCARNRVAHRTPPQPRIHHGRAHLSQSADRDRRRDQHCAHA